MTKSIIEKIIETLEYLIAPICGVALIWGFDISAYVTAGTAAIISILRFIALFIKK